MQIAQPARRSLFTKQQDEAAPVRSQRPEAHSSPQLAKARSAGKATSKAASREAKAVDLGRLKRLGFATLAECLLSAPKEYRDFTAPKLQVLQAEIGRPGYFILRLGARALFDRKGNTVKFAPKAYRIQMDCVDGDGVPVRVVAFGNVWPFLTLESGEDIHLYGTLKEWRGNFEVASPILVQPEQRGKIASIYKGKQGQVSAETLSEGVARALDRLDEAGVLLLAQAGLRTQDFARIYGVDDPRKLLWALHRPKTVGLGLRARLIAQKMSADTVARRAAAAKTRPAVAKSAIAIDKQFLGSLVADLPYPLTEDQRRCVDEIVEDLRSAFPMRRLLSGDVGTGKSITFMLPIAAAYEAGAEIAVLAPSLPVAEQLAKEMGELFPGLPVSLVTAGEKITEGVCIGTTALLNAAKRAKKAFDLVVVDEQHKFSVDQKLALVGRSTNLLEATATAIPRSLALINFGGMDVSILRECPVKKEIETVVVDDEAMPDVLEFTSKDILAGGGQLAVIYPLVDGAGDAESSERDSDGRESVLGAAQMWEKRFPGRVAVLHGRMTKEEKSDVIRGMHEQRFQVLISSTVIEVGITLPSLQAIIIESPERYGLSQLHQLRGRLARKGGSGTMFLHVGPHVQPEAMERLRMLESCNDGFSLAEMDMGIRGFGEVEDDAQVQTGTARALFHGVELTHEDIRSAAVKMGLVV